MLQRSACACVLVLRFTSVSVATKNAKRSFGVVCRFAFLRGGSENGRLSMTDAVNYPPKTRENPEVLIFNSKDHKEGVSRFAETPKIAPEESALVGMQK